MLDVYFTVDVELWCNGWKNLDAKFKKAFDKHILGITKKGNFGLPYKLKVLNDYGLKGVFFVEPLFSLRFGVDPLAEIIGMILEANQSVELHMHTEWVDEINDPRMFKVKKKLQHIRYFTPDEQNKLIEIGKKLLIQTGVEKIHAFRAGSFGFNLHTLSALQKNNIYIDSSYNASLLGPSSGFMPGQIITSPIKYNKVVEVPMTVYTDWPGHLKHAQLCSCLSDELEGLLKKYLEEGRKDVVILSHSFELLDKLRKRPSPIVIKRFHKLCEFLDKNRDYYTTKWFSDFSFDGNSEQLPPIKSNVINTGKRYFEQIVSRYKVIK